MIESCYWREELRAEIRWLRANQKFTRRSEKKVVLFERKLMLVAFQVRTLLDRPKVNDAVRAVKFQASEYPKIGKKPYTYIGSGWPDEHFDLNKPKDVLLSTWDVCNQLIHYYWMSTSSEAGRFTSVLVFSDYKRHTCAYEFDVGRLLSLFSAFGDERSAVHGSSFEWNEKKQDHVMVKARGPIS
jgi:hypothetical protein